MTHLFSTDIRMEFDFEKCRVLILKREQVGEYGGVELPNSNMMRVIKNEGYKCLGILENEELSTGSRKDI